MSTALSVAAPKNETRLGPVYLLAAVLAGLVMPVQSRVNGALGTHLGDPVAASLVSFTTGLVLLVVVSIFVPSARAGAKLIPVALRERRFPRWYLAAGCVGAMVVVTQSLTVPLVGVALFTVALVTGQTIGSMLVDGIGFGPGGRRRINALRAVGAVLAVVGVLWAVSPRMATSEAVASLLLPLLLPLVVGFLMGFQSAMNGVQAQTYGTPVAATLMNFAVGAVLLGVILLVRLPFTGAPNPLPTQWWYYLGGPLGCVFIGLSAFLVKHLGVLLTGLGMIGGQLVGSLLIDLVLPAPGALVNAATIGGTLLTLAAVALASVAGGKRPRVR
ncbi:DMT family transporter [Paeniglutamicibacter sp. NPDC091659]|uniref:DMT family transporter n=1 Tax=Paeniglutamicibacter sp. NPDC091659 TaxID=3364389 RepID=UPI003818D4E3